MVEMLRMSPMLNEQHVCLWSKAMRVQLISMVGLGLCVVYASHALAEYDKDQLIDAMVEYVAINDVMEKLSHTCSHTVRFENTTAAAIQETIPHFRKQDQNWIKSYISGPKAKARFANHSTYIDRFLRDMGQQGVDEKTACATLAGSVMTMHQTAQSKWQKAIALYAK